MGIYKVIRIKLPHIPKLKLQTGGGRYKKKSQNKKGLNKKSLRLQKLSRGHKHQNIRFKQRFSAKKIILLIFLCIVLCKAAGRLLPKSEQPQGVAPTVMQSQPEDRQTLFLKDILPFY